MNYYKPRQRITDKRWDYTCMNDGVVFPVGYCSAYHEPNEVDRKLSPAWAERYESEKDKYHGHGHDTPEEAAECYRQYLLDQRLTFSEMNRGQDKCVVCGEWTTLLASVDHTYTWELCEKHRNREEVEKLFKLSADSEIISSF